MEKDNGKWYSCDEDKNHIVKKTISIPINKKKKLIFLDYGSICYIMPWNAKKYLKIIHKIGLHCQIKWFGFKLVIN